MEAQVQNIKLNNWRIYKVTYEHLKTRKQYSIHVEAPDSQTAGDSIVGVLGDEYDLVQSRNAKPAELN